MGNPNVPTQSMLFRIPDESGVGPDIEVMVERDAYGISLTPYGYAVDGGYAPLVLDYHAGKLQVMVYDNRGDDPVMQHTLGVRGETVSQDE